MRSFVIIALLIHILISLHLIKKDTSQLLINNSFLVTNKGTVECIYIGNEKYTKEQSNGKVD